MNQERELELWRAAWVAATPAQLPRRRDRRLRITYVLNLLFAALLIAFAAWFLRAHWSRETLAWAVVVWLTTAGATGFHVWNWRILWQTSGQSVMDYAASQRRQCQAMLRSVRFGYGLLALQDAITVPWLTWDFLHGRLPSGPYTVALLLLLIFNVSFLLWFGRSRRSAQRQLAQISEFQRSLAGE